MLRNKRKYKCIFVSPQHDTLIQGLNVESCQDSSIVFTGGTGFYNEDNRQWHTSDNEIDIMIILNFSGNFYEWFPFGYIYSHCSNNICICLL